LDFRARTVVRDTWRPIDAKLGAFVCGRAADVFGGWESVGAAVPVARDVGATSSMTLPVSIGDRELWLSFVAVESAEGVVYAFRDLTGERRLDEEKRDFVATISHELRTPMTGVYGAAQTLLRTDIEWDASQRRHLLELIASQAERLSQIVDELLLATSIDHDRVQVSQESVDVRELVRRTLEVLEAPAVEVDIPDQPHVLGDRDRIQQILVNLLDNAFKYGQPPVKVIVAPTNDALEVAVCDAGTGIPREEEERIFEKFYRSDPELARAPSGTGLGLYIARALAERMDGMLDVRAAPGGGTEFVLTLQRS
jgi:signal transduction histidine kinase